MPAHLSPDQGHHSGGRSVHALHVHLVFVTKRRGRVFDDAQLRYLGALFGEVCARFHATLSAFNGESDHVHLLVQYPPTVRLSELVNHLKGISSRRLKQRFPGILGFWSLRCSGNALWSPSYFAASAGGAPLEVLAQYVRSQCRPKQRYPSMP